MSDAPIRATVPETLIALLRATEAEAAQLSAPLSEPQQDALTRAAYPLVDEAHALRRRYDEACRMLQSATDRLERARDRVAAAEQDGIFAGMPSQRENEARLRRVHDVLHTHPYGRAVLAELEPAPGTPRVVEHLLTQLQTIRAAHLALQRLHMEQATHLTAAERGARDGEDWRRTCRQVAQTLRPCYPADVADESNVVWLAEHVAEAFDALRDRAAGLFAGRMSVAQHDAREPWPVRGDVVLCSPPYACRAAGSATTRVGTLPHRVRALGEGKMGERWAQFLAAPSPGSDDAIRFFYGEHPAQIGHFRGARYWESMLQVYARAWEALPAGGLMILVLKDHIRDGRRVRVCDETAARVESLGFVLQSRHARHLGQLSLWQRRRREQGLPVVEEEEALVFTRGLRRP